MNTPRRWADPALLGVTAFALPAGLALRGLDHGEFAILLWNGSAVLAASLLLVEILARLRRKEIGVDLIALLAIGAAVFFAQALVAALIALMLASGRMLENYSDTLGAHQVADMIVTHQSGGSQDGYVGCRDDNVAVAVFANGHDRSPLRGYGCPHLHDGRSDRDSL